MKKIFLLIKNGLICGIISLIILMILLHILGLLKPPFAPIAFIIFIIFLASIITAGTIEKFKYISYFKKLFVGFFSGAVVGIIFIVLFLFLNIFVEIGEGFEFFLIGLIIISILGGISGLISVSILHLKEKLYLGKKSDVK